MNLVDSHKAILHLEIQSYHFLHRPSPREKIGSTPGCLMLAAPKLPMFGTTEHWHFKFQIASIRSDVQVPLSKVN
jgi:hypothetical protein